MAFTNDNLYEYETQFFGFSPKGFVDTVHNIIVEVWASTVQNEIVCNLSLENTDSQRITNLMKKLILLICKHNRLEHMMDKLEQHVVTYVFRIPDFLTLPEDLPNLEVNEGIDEDTEINKRIKELEEEIVELRLASVALNDEIENTEKVLRLVHELEESSETTEACAEMDCS